jgi:hypothetical protein
VEEHDEGIVRSNGIVGMLGCTRGVCIELVGCVGEGLFRRRLDYTGNVSRSGVWGKQVVRGGIGGYGSRYLLSNVTDRVQSGVIVVWREVVCLWWIWLYTSSVWGVDVFHTWR